MFEKPETFEGISLDDLRALSEQALTEARDIMANEDADLTDEQIARVEVLMSASAEIDAEVSTRETAAAERADRISALRGQVKDSTPDEGDEPDEGEDDPEEEDPAEEPDEDAEANTEKEVVVASAPTRRTVAIAKKSAPEVEEPQGDDQSGWATLVAAADVPGFTTGQSLGDMLEVANAFQSRSRGFSGGAGSAKPQVLAPNVFGLSENHRRYGVAKIQKPEYEFTVDDRMSAQDQMDIVMAASKEARLPQGNLVAAGGWCAPSEQIYGFCELESVSGILSLPEVQARRGGISFTKGPDYGTLAANWGFLQTEAQAEAGTAKVCYSIDCPPWTEVRLDAIGFCVTAPVLTNAAFPELINRVLQIGAVAHAHHVNASVISRISTAIGAAINWTEVGGSTSDILDAAALQADRLRYTYSMDPNTTIEAIFPIWVKGFIRADVGRRLNIDNPLNVTDAMIMSWFGVRGIAPQFVYDYQPLSATTPAFPASAPTTTWTAYPTAVEFMMYPAGAFTKLTKDVIDLDTIYDSVGLSTNVYTAAFFEEGLAVANTCGSGVKVQVSLDTKGATGFPSVGAGAGVTFSAS
jgi:hypothetical protein